MVGVVTDFQLGRLIGFHLASKIHEFDVRYLLSDAGGATEVTVDADIRWKFPMNLVATFLGKRMRKTLDGQVGLELKKLKEICESAYSGSCLPIIQGSCRGLGCRSGERVARLNFINSLEFSTFGEEVTAIGKDFINRRRW